MRLLEFFCLSLCGACLSDSLLVKKAGPSTHGRRLTGRFFGLVVLCCGRGERITFCTSGLYVASGCLSTIVGRIDKGATGS